MSSMLKKTGGLSFKPKAGRRPGANSKPTAPSTAAPSTAAPITEPQSQTATPVIPNLSTSSTIDPADTPIDSPSKESTPAEPVLTPAHTQERPATEPHGEALSSQSTLHPIAPLVPPPLSIAQRATPEPSNEVVNEPVQCLATHIPVTDSSEHHDVLPTPNREEESNISIVAEESNIPSVANTLPQHSSSASTTVPELPIPGEAALPVLPEPSTGPTLPPVSDLPVVLSQSVEAVAPQSPALAKRTPTRRKSAASSSRAGTGDSAPKKKRQRSKPSTNETAGDNPGATSEPQKPSRRRKREPTPENAEELTVDHATMTVGELTRDLGIGKRFRHAEEIEQRAREARAKYRLKRLEREKRRLGLLPHEHDESSSQMDMPDGNSETQGTAMAQLGASMESGGVQGVGYDVVDGQIVVHAASLVVNRHNQDMSNLEEVEENDFTNLINSASFAKRVQAPGNWTDEDTEKFYRLLGMFGTDFETISRLFPGKNRRAIKLKFNKEERLRPNRVNSAMMVRGQKKVNIDIEEYKATQHQWQTKDKIMEEHARVAEEHEREVSRLRDERRAAGLIDDDHSRRSKKNANAPGSGQENQDVEVIEEDADVLGQGGQGIDGDMDAPPEGIQS